MKKKKKKKFQALYFILKNDSKNGLKKNRIDLWKMAAEQINICCLSFIYLFWT